MWLQFLTKPKLRSNKFRVFGEHVLDWTQAADSGLCSIGGRSPAFLQTSWRDATTVFLDYRGNVQAAPAGLLSYRRASVRLQLTGERLMKWTQVAVEAVLGLAILGGPAGASIVIDISQVGGDVVTAGSGTVDLSGLDFLLSEPGSGVIFRKLVASSSGMTLGRWISTPVLADRRPSGRAESRAHQASPETSWE